MAIPYRESDLRRRELFTFTTGWIAKYHDWPIRTGASPAGPFNRGAAVNDAASQVDWDVLVVHDADNIADPETLGEAVDEAAATGQVVYPFTVYTYLDEVSSNRIMAGGSWFTAPEVHPRFGVKTTVRLHHYSGIQVIPRAAWDRVGGFVQLTGWGAEDAIMDTLFRVFARGSQWLGGGAFHLWHEAKRNDPNDQHNVANHRVWARVQSVARRNSPEALRRYLNTVGHVVP